MSTGESTPRWGELFRDSDPAPRQRLPYGAVPLDPWRASLDPVDHQPYWNTSIDRIKDKLRHSVKDKDWLKRDPRFEELYDIMEGSLIRSHYARLDKNGEVNLGAIVNPEDERFEWAMDGTATPAELFTLLADHHEIGSLELAKLSHPFDFNEPNEMDRTMDELMLTIDGKLLEEEPTYKVKRVDALPAAIVLRKHNLMDFPADDGGMVRIVHRQGYLVFQGKGAENEAHFDRLVQNSKHATALKAKIDWYLYEHPIGEPGGWVQPQASSYYAKYIPVKPVAI